MNEPGIIRNAICICRKSFQDAEKDSLRPYNGMAIVSFSGRAICYNASLISRHYLEIQTHTITIHTEHGDYQKYGSLTDEQKFLAPYGFIRCRQNCLVSLEKIQSICDNTIILVNHLQLHMSQRYAPKVLAAFARSRVSR